VSGFARKANLATYQSVAIEGGVATADPHGLVQMLLDASVERIASARASLEQGDRVRKAKLLHSCVTLIAELRGSLDLIRGGALAQNLSDLYEYIAKQLLLANVRDDAAPLNEALSLLGEIRSAWIAIGPEVRAAAARQDQRLVPSR
jgi:flagellar protein FliS